LASAPATNPKMTQLTQSGTREAYADGTLPASSCGR
jgi:hypothetical protein